MFYYLTTGLAMDFGYFSNEYRPKLWGGGVSPNRNGGGVIMGQSHTLLYIIAKISTKKNFSHEKRYY